MWWTLDWINYHETRTMGFKISKVSIGFLILVYFGINLVICNDDIPVCSEQHEDLVADMEDWIKNCLNVDSKDQNIQCCEEQKKYNQERMSTHTQMCFYKGKSFKVGMTRACCLGYFFVSHKKYLSPNFLNRINVVLGQCINT